MMKELINKNTNRFFDLFICYHNVVNKIAYNKTYRIYDEIIDKCKESVEPEKSGFSLFKKNSVASNKSGSCNQIYKDLIKDLANRYYRTCLSVDNMATEDWFKFMREFIEFLDIAEDMCLYINNTSTEESDTCIDIDKQSSSYVMYMYDTDNFITYRISFIDTQIERPTSNSTIMKFLEGSDCNIVEDSKTTTLIQFDIMRKHGKQKHTEFKFMTGSDYKLTITSDEQLMSFECMKNYITKIVFKTLNDILYNTNLLFGIENSVDEVLNGTIILSEQ